MTAQLPGSRTRSGRTIVSYVPSPQSCCRVHRTSAIQPRPSSQSRQHRCAPGHQAPSCSISTSRGGSYRRSSISRTGPLTAATVGAR